MVTNHYATPFCGDIVLSSEMKKRIESEVERVRKERNCTPLPMLHDMPMQISSLSDLNTHHGDEDLSELLDDETLFRFSYVPFVIAELVWDYVDTILIFAAQQRIEPTKKLSRTLHQLRDSYNHYRERYIDRAHRESETNNMYVFEEGVKHIFSTFFVNIKADILHEHPDLCSDSVWYLTAVYQAHITLRALFLYVSMQKERVEKIVGHSIGDILPKHIRALDPAILAFVGDSPASKNFEKLGDSYVRTLATQMALVELNKDGLDDIAK